MAPDLRQIYNIGTLYILCIHSYKLIVDQARYTYIYIYIYICIYIHIYIHIYIYIYILIIYYVHTFLIVVLTHHMSEIRAMKV